MYPKIALPATWTRAVRGAGAETGASGAVLQLASEKSWQLRPGWVVGEKDGLVSAVGSQQDLGW